MLPDIQAVLFDAVGTLIFPDPPVAAAYAAAGARFGSKLTLDEIGRRFRTAFARQEAVDAEKYGHRTSEDRENTRWQAIVAEVFDDANDPPALFEALWEHFAEPRHWRLYADAAELWAMHAARAALTCIASNFDGRLTKICQGLPPLDRCRHVFVSSELGVRKPSPDFFRAIERRLNLRPSQLLLIGDDWHSDYLAAKAAGWQAKFIDRSP
ncbi:MAG TPA: HAD-IA family hydrolase [Pirellulales bacterium]|nr:HAD-IA family hydrolase [Pirellulales bacterium]